MRLAGLAMARAAAGDRQGARRLLLRAADSAARRDRVFTLHAVVCLAEGWAALGERDRAFAWLRRFARAA